MNNHYNNICNYYPIMCKLNICLLKFIQATLVIVSLISFNTSVILMSLYIGVYDQEYIKNMHFFGELSIYLLLISLFSYNIYTQVKKRTTRNLTNVIPTNMEDDDYE